MPFVANLQLQSTHISDKRCGRNERQKKIQENKLRVVCCLVGRLVSWLTGWLFGSSVAWLVGWLVGIYAIIRFRKVRRKSNFAQVRTEYTHCQLHTCVHTHTHTHTHTMESIHMYNYVCVCVCVCVHIQGSLATIHTQHPGTLSAAARPPHSLCYRPAVCFRQLRFAALSLPQRKNSERFKNVTISDFFFTLKLRKSEIVYRRNRLSRRGSAFSDTVLKSAVILYKEIRSKRVETVVRPHPHLNSRFTKQLLVRQLLKIVHGFMEPGR